MEPCGNVLLCRRSHKHLHTTTPTRKIIAGLLGNMSGAPAERSSWINHHSSALRSPFSANENFTCFIVEARMTTSCFQAFKRFLCPHVPLFHIAGCLFSLEKAVTLFSSSVTWKLFKPLDFFVSRRSPTFTINRISLWLTRCGSLKHKDLGITMMSSSKL